MTDKAIAAAVEAWFADPTMRKSDLMQDRMRAAIAAYQAVVGEGWQPIESAPKDFVTTVDLWNGERNADCIWGRSTYGRVYCWIRETGYDSDGPVWDALRPSPTHWMPLPEPPKESK